MNILELIAQTKSSIQTWVASNLATKVDKENGKGLSSNDFTDEEKEKLAGIENVVSGNGVNVNYSTTFLGEFGWNLTEDMTEPVAGITKKTIKDEDGNTIETVYQDSILGDMPLNSYDIIMIEGEAINEDPTSSTMTRINFGDGENMFIFDIVGYCDRHKTYYVFSRESTNSNIYKCIKNMSVATNYKNDDINKIDIYSFDDFDNEDSVTSDFILKDNTNKIYAYTPNRFGLEDGTNRYNFTMKIFGIKF